MLSQQHHNLRQCALHSCIDFSHFLLPQELTSRKDQKKYLQKGHETKFLGVREIADAFERSPLGAARNQDLDSPPVPAPKAVVTSGTEANANAAPFSTDPLVRSRYALGNRELFKALAARDLLYFSRNAFLYIFQEFQTVLVGTLAATMFLRTNMQQSTIEDGYVYLGLLFFTTMTAMW